MIYIYIKGAYRVSDYNFWIFFWGFLSSKMAQFWFEVLYPWCQAERRGAEHREVSSQQSLHGAGAVWRKHCKHYWGLLKAQQVGF